MSGFSLEFISYRGKLLKDAPLSEYTSWRLGGPAEYLFLPADRDDLVSFLKQLPKHIPITWIGLGSNVLIRDGGVRGITIITQGGLNNIALTDNVVRAEAGVASSQLARYVARLGGAELAFLAGIPGTIGGALAMNAGCFGGETWDFVKEVEVIYRNGEIKTLPAKDFERGYRYVKKPLDGWFLAGYFFFNLSNKEKALATIKSLIEKRNNAQPTGTANCGSVFKNPTGDFAGRLIETCGLKGKKCGGAQVSSKHANFIINEGGATASDVETLIQEVGTIVEQRTGVRLIAEVCILGENFLSG